jgi:AAA family ATPase
VALIAESYIVDLKFITSRQVIELSYEGITRQFTIHSIRPRDSEEHSQTGDLSHSINALSISPQPLQLWKVDWDCTVSILEDQIQVDGRSSQGEFGNQEPNQIFISPSIQAAIEIPSNQPSRDTYASVGGLDKQIEIIRDLLEIPLTRPELFRTFG